MSAEFITVIFSVAADFQTFRRRMGAAEQLLNHNRLIYARLAASDLLAHSMALRCGARIAPSSRIVSLKP